MFSWNLSTFGKHQRTCPESFGQVSTKFRPTDGQSPTLQWHAQAWRRFLQVFNFYRFVISKFLHIFSFQLFYSTDKTNHFRRNLLALNIHLREMSIEVMTQRRTFDFFSLISNYFFLAHSTNSFFSPLFIFFGVLLNSNRSFTIQKGSQKLEKLAKTKYFR